MTCQITIAANTNLEIYKDVSPFTEPQLSTHSKKQKLELWTLHRVFPSSSLHTYTLLFLALCLSIYNILLLHIDIPKMLLYEYTDLTLQNVITIYLETYIQKFNLTFLYMRDVNPSFYHIVWQKLTWYKLWHSRLIWCVDQWVIDISNIVLEGSEGHGVHILEPFKWCEVPLLKPGKP